MLSTLYILFILVMTHAFEALPFAGQGYYGSKFHKITIKGNTDKKVHKPIFSLMHPMIFHKKVITKVPIKGFRKGHPFLTPSLVGKLPIDKMQLGKPRFDFSSLNNEPFSYFKSSFFPLQNNPEQPVLIDLKNSKRIPNIYELTFENLKPPVRKINMPFDAKTDFKQIDAANQPLPNVDNAKIITIDIVKGNELASEKLVKPENGGVLNEPHFDITTNSDVPNGGLADLTIFEFGDPGSNEKPFVDSPMQYEIGKDTNVHGVDINTVPDISSFDINGKMPEVVSNKDIVTHSIGKEVGASVTKILPDTAATIGDIPGFIVDGGTSLEAARTEPIYDVTSEIQRHEQGTDVLNVNDVMLTKTETFDLKSNDLLPKLNGDNLAISGDLNINRFLDIGIQSAVDTEQIVTNGLPGSNTDLNTLDNNAIQRLHPFEVGVNDLSVSNDISVSIKPIGNIVDNIVNISGENFPTTEQDINNHGIGSVVIIRPVSFHMKVEPFGPGPYGQCREPSRVICGARFGWEHVTGMVEWCKLNCIVYMYSSYCDDDRCQCKCV